MTECNYQYDSHCEKEAIAQVEYEDINGRIQKWNVCGYCLRIMKNVMVEYDIKHKITSLVWNVS